MSAGSRTACHSSGVGEGSDIRVFPFSMSITASVSRRSRSTGATTVESLRGRPPVPLAGPGLRPSPRSLRSQRARPSACRCLPSSDLAPVLAPPWRRHRCLPCRATFRQAPPDRVRALQNESVKASIVHPIGLRALRNKVTTPPIPPIRSLFQSIRAEKLISPWGACPIPSDPLLLPTPHTLLGDRRRPWDGRPSTHRNFRLGPGHRCGLGHGSAAAAAGLPGVLRSPRAALSLFLASSLTVKNRRCFDGERAQHLAQATCRTFGRTCPDSVRKDVRTDRTHPVGVSCPVRVSGSSWCVRVIALPATATLFPISRGHR